MQDRLTHHARQAVGAQQVAVTDQGLIRSTISATSLAHAQRIVGNIRSDYQACQTTYAAIRAYRDKVHKYATELAAYKKKHHTTQPVRNKAGKVVARPPAKPSGTAPSLGDCPKAPGTGASS